MESKGFFMAQMGLVLPGPIWSKVLTLLILKNGLAAMVIGSLAALTGCLLMFFEMLPIYGNVVPGTALFLSQFCFVSTHRIHVWYIYLHVVDFYGKFWCIYRSSHGSVMGNECNRGEMALREGWSCDSNRSGAACVWSLATSPRDPGAARFRYRRNYPHGILLKEGM